MAGLVLTCVMKDKDGGSRFPSRLTLLRPSLLPPLLVPSPWCVCVCVVGTVYTQKLVRFERGVRTVYGEKWRVAEAKRASVGTGGRRSSLQARLSRVNLI